ncbi:hypothetical protein Q5P01_000646 [Channa striata]|uniref:SET domain-containing protein n=1 Tax=Channa striata TaxID=64152 RepID=A0AA88LFR3_CHASR|nr:hypothetical protein Q5P01_000646 [Channa striata]
MLGIFGNLQEEKIVSAEEKTLFRYYCEAILILGHFQRPGAVEGMTVPGWLNKNHLNGRVCVGVSQQIASFSLTPEESAFLDAHYLYVRPDCVRENVDDDGKFFISPKGRPIRSASNDLSRLHAHYKIPSVTSQEIRRVVETAASTAFNEEQKAMVAHYMAHSTPVANTHYRLRTAICTTAVCASLAGYRAFVKGAVICDYHGELVTAEEGRKILESSTDEMGYLYFFTSGSQQLCINAQTHPCRCHPTMETMGRKMNHSKNNLNVKPQHCKIKFPEGEKDTLLLVAARDIAVHEELRFDYGVNRKSFRGEGLDREWLDE